MRNAWWWCGVALAIGCSSSDDAAPAPGGAGGAAGAGGAPTCQADDQAATARESCAFAVGAAADATLGCSARTGAAMPVEHIVILMQENRSFDHYFGRFTPPAGQTLDVPPANASNPTTLGGATTSPWHHLDTYCVRDTNHEWSGAHTQYDDGKMDGYYVSNQPGGERAMGWYDGTDLPFYYALASQFPIADRYFAGLLGPTYPNRLYLYAGTSFGLSENVFAPSGSRGIFHALSDAKIDWKVYRSDVPGAAILDFSLVTSAETRPRFVDVSEFAKDAAAGTLPAVSFIDPSFAEKSWVETDEHPPSDVQVGQHFVWQQVQALLHSPAWATSALFITYDENGGIYDHVAPPSACVPDDLTPNKEPELGGFDRYGFRVPLIVVSPFAKKQYVSHVVHSHSSVLRFVEAKFGLPAFTRRDANSDALLDMFDFDHPPFATPPTFDEPPIDAAQLDACKLAFPK